MDNDNYRNDESNINDSENSTNNKEPFLPIYNNKPIITPSDSQGKYTNQHGTNPNEQGQPVQKGEPGYYNNANNFGGQHRYTQPYNPYMHDSNPVQGGRGNYSDQTNMPKYSYNGQNNNFKEPRKEKKITRNTLIAFMVITVVLSAILGIGGGLLAYNLGGNRSIVYQSSNTGNSVSPSTGEGMTIAQVADIASNSVVEIRTESVQTSQYMRQYVTEGAGSGVIISGDGYIVTNNHVIENTSKITVTLKNGQSYEASIIGKDTTTDVALLKINESNLTPAVLGESSSLKVGGIALAIGNPLGELGGSVSNGIISALDREITVSGSDMTLLQTDAAINPGNSGGGLFNGKGELIGIVVAKSSGEDIEGLGFAIPIDNVKSVFNDLLKYGYVKGRPQLGVSLVDINSAQTAFSYGVTQMGVYVYSVIDNSGAAKAGLKSGDCVQAIDDQAVSSSSDVKSIIQKHNVGDVIKMTIVRDGKQQQVEVTLTESTPTTTSTSKQYNKQNKVEG